MSIAVTVVACLAFAIAPASAQATRWYWHTASAEEALKVNYTDAEFVGCYGYGKSIRGRRSQRLYQRFYCTLYYLDGGSDDGRLKVTGKDDYRWFWS